MRGLPRHWRRKYFDLGGGGGGVGTIAARGRSHHTTLRPRGGVREGVPLPRKRGSSESVLYLKSSERPSTFHLLSSFSWLQVAK